MEPTAAEASVASVREQVESLVSRHRRSRAGTRASARRVQVRRIAKPTPGWRITAPIEGSFRRSINISFSHQQVELGDARIVIHDVDVVMFVGAGLKADKLTLCLAEATRPLLERVRGIYGLPAPEDQKKLDEPARQIAATRAYRAVSKAIANSPIEALADAASAPSDVEVVVRALQQPDAIETLQADDALGPARLRGLRERERLLSLEGGTLPVDDVAKHLHLTRQAVNKRRHQGTLLGLDAGRHGYRYPAWQFGRAGTIAGLEAVLAALDEHDAWMQHIFMVSRNTRLKGRMPLEALRQGRLEDVLKAAHAFGDHGAA